MCVVGFLGGIPAVAAGQCPNEAFRTGRSASLPDCRAYELVTPKDLGRTQDLTLEEALDHVLPSSDGEHLALLASGIYLEHNVSTNGTAAVFSRTPTGWVMKSVATPAMASTDVIPQLFSPDLSQVAFSSEDLPTRTKASFEFGPVGGPYSNIATLFGTPSELEATRLAGTNAGTSTVPAFSDVLLESDDRGVLPPGREREIAEQAEPEAPDLYELENGRLQLVNVNSEDDKLLNPCGAELGFDSLGGNAINAVSDDGSKVFFTSPTPFGGCKEQPQLYMRVNGRETVDVSEPEGVSVPPSERGQALYDGASISGSKVFFTTATGLTLGTGSGFKLYEYDTEAPLKHRLTLIANEVGSVEREAINPNVVISEYGSAVYYQGAGIVKVGGRPVSVSGIWRYETATRSKSFVATPRKTGIANEPAYSTPDGNFFVFPSGSGGTEVVGSGGLQVETRGVGHEELYRYDAVDGSVMCVSCGEGVAPARGGLRVPEGNTSTFEIGDQIPTAISISDDGQRVFFQTSAKLVSQDTNEDDSEEEAEDVKAPLGAGSDVYEWEQDGTEEESGVVCRVADGCTHLISTGEAVGPERFLGASANGDDVFFTSAAQLVPGATLEFTNIYDARVDGGFPPPPPIVECASCQGVGNPAPQFGAPASMTLAGIGNPPASMPIHKVTKPKRCKRGYRRDRRSRCVRVKARGRRRP